MIANINRVGNELTAKLERHIPHSVEEVWSMFSENDKLTQWFPELSVTNLDKGQVIKFDMQDGTFADLNILRSKEQSLLEFDWFGDRVRFEFQSKEDETLLLFEETIHTITDQTAKDIAGWHVCILVIEALLDGKTIENRLDIWKPWYDKYVLALTNIENNK